MKRYVKASSANSSLMNSSTGSAGPANAKKGIIKFGSQKEVTFDNGLHLSFLTGVVRVNVQTGETSTYCNIYVHSQVHYNEFKIKGSKEWTGLTSEEVTKVFNTLKEMTAEEFLKLNDVYKIKYDESGHFLGRVED